MESLFTVHHHKFAHPIMKVDGMTTATMLEQLEMEDSVSM